MRIRAYLGLMALAILCPVIIFSAISLDMLLESERAALIRSMRETVRASTLMVDRELGSAEAALRVLAASPYLLNEDMPGLYRLAKAADHGDGAWTLLIDEQGRQIVNTSVPYGTPLPTVNRPERIGQVLTTQKVAVSDILTGALTGKMLTTVNFPVEAASGNKYVLATVFTADYLRRQMLQPTMPADWIVAVLDKQGRFITRSKNAEQLIGKPGKPELVKAASLATDGALRVATLEGVDSQQVFTHSPLSGWTIAVAAPVKSVEDAARRAVAVAGLGLLAALVSAAAAAAFFGSRLVTSIRTASRSAAALGRGDTPDLVASPVAELEELHTALNNAGTILLHERESRRHAEAERERLFLAAQEARSIAEAQNQAKDQFLAMLGHEIRNPLSAMSGAVTIMNLDHVSEEQLARARTILARQCENLEHIVNDLLDVARVTSGKIMLNTRRLDLAEVVRSCVDALHAAGRTSHLTLALQAEPAWIEADQTRLEQIVNNLLGNALKYTREGGRIEVVVRADGPDALLSVSDNGIGIPADLLPHVFDIFAQGSAALDRAQGGLGIGLTLVRKLVLLHGGTVLAESAGRGQGSRFTVRLPLSAPADYIPLGSVASSRPEARTVLLIEDNSDSRAMMALMLTMKGHRVLEAANGPDGIRIAKDQQPDIAVIDIGLPGMTGHQIAHQLRADEKTARIGLIALTGYGLEADRQSAIEAGFDKHMVKPVELPELEKAMEIHATRKRHA